MPKVRLFPPASGCRGCSIEWNMTAHTGEEEIETSGTCAGRSTDVRAPIQPIDECWLTMLLPACRPWEDNATSCLVRVRARSTMPAAEAALPSSQAEWDYLITPPPPVAPPTFEPARGGAFVEPFGEGVAVTISCAGGAEPRYTRNGQVPTRFSTRYSGPVTIERGVTDLQVHKVPWAKATDYSKYADVC